MLSNARGGRKRKDYNLQLVPGEGKVPNKTVWKFFTYLFLKNAAARDGTVELLNSDVGCNQPAASAFAS